MIRRPTLLILLLLAVSSIYQPAFSQSTQKTFVYGDALPDAPELSVRGSNAVGVQTIEVVNKNQVDVLSFAKDSLARYDRKLTLEVWYPTTAPAGLITYDEVMGQNCNPERPIIPFSFSGRATRKAAPLLKDGPYPLIIVSHGYTGSRYLMTYLTENLASKGYVVVSIDHMESTFRDADGFPSTLLNRSLDDLFVLNEIARLSKDKGSFLAGLVNTGNTALVGYSMGGYGAVNVAGGGYSPQAVELFGGMAGGSKALAVRMRGNAAFEASIDPRIKVIVAFAPWGMERGLWDAEGLAGIKIPSLFVAGSMDDVSGYEKGIKAIYEGAVNSDRYMLTYIDARHNVAPNPPPVEAMQPGLNINEYLRYADSVWDMRRINNINQHFVTAFLGMHLKGMAEYKKYLDVPVESSAEVWTGFKPRTSIGLQMAHDAPEK
ncbi:dienelactone hydrolase [Imperialibacter roseus]|uniref:Dienelactone hydrolase n=1 Tax=Imperialibacter roseus TaxID=1324217 RepID=A0ABZ0IKX5_9BACT|nr:dienelactone hydrolase [Imperialibacter roseus]WOK05673.1 dienelactone hydrolase [Imperialibacter roseus]